jgi:two-component system, NtrC family, sensor kinase
LRGKERPLRRSAKPAQAKIEAKLSVRRKAPRNEGGRVRDLEKRLAEALEQQTATAEILSIISRSPTDIQQVLEAVAQSASRLCGAANISLYRVEGSLMRKVAEHGPPLTALRVGETRSITRTSVSGRAIIDGTTIHVPDHQSAEAAQEYPDAQRDTGIRTTIGLPLLCEGVAIGAFTAYRTESRSFSEREISLLQTFADQAAIAIENARLFNETKEALEQQTATAEILRVISSSQTDYQPVFDTIVRTAGLVCSAVDAVLWTTDGDELVVRAHHGPISATIGARQPMHGSVAGYAVRERSVVHVKDLTKADDFPVGRDLARRLGWRTTLSAPLLREGVAVGALLIRRSEVRPFSDRQIALVQTFADQAVIAIENVRLFTALEARNRDLTATSEILRVTSTSPTDVQPVFDAIVASAARLCDAVFSALGTFDGELMDIVAAHNWTPAAWDAARRTWPARPNRALASGRAILEGAVVHIPDVDLDREYDSPEMSHAVGFRSILSVPMMRHDQPVGVIAVGRAEPGPFSDSQITLLRTFADQAVIAIENVRLFKELEARNRDLTTALDKQTATSDILRTIAGSQTDVQPVFDAIVASAARLLGGYTSTLSRVMDNHVALVALTRSHDEADAALRARFPQPLDSREAHAQTIRARAPLNIADAVSDPRLPEAQQNSARARGFRSLVLVPLLHQGAAIGAIGVSRREPGGFTYDEIALLKTFADQAVIAIENVRLFKELQVRTHQLTRSVEQLTALREVGHAVSSSLDSETVLNTIVARAVQLAGAHSGTIWEYDAAAEEFVLRITQNVEDPELRANPNARVRRGEGAVGRLAVTQRPVQIPDITHEGAYAGRLRDSLVVAGTRALLAIPLLHEHQLLGGLVISRRTPGEFPAEVVDLLASFATQSALALQNARLFLEIEDKSRQLEAASQHKSEFLSNMSHELRTPLNAIIGFSEVLSERMFGELNEKQEEYLKDIHASGQHLLSLINDILDLSKIEAGRMELELTNFDLPAAIYNALALVRERAGRRGIDLQQAADEGLGQIRADERKIKQVLLNLLSNAIKFTPEGGRIEVRAVPVDDSIEVSVTDTGVGIAPEDQEAIFEEFRQVGTAAKKVEGTGLGLTLSRKFIELHGGRIWVESQVGVGSTFRFTLPVCRGE